MSDIEPLFQRLWTKAVGTGDYDKSQWTELERLINSLTRKKEVEHLRKLVMFGRKCTHCCDHCTFCGNGMGNGKWDGDEVIHTEDCPAFTVAGQWKAWRDSP